MVDTRNDDPEGASLRKRRISETAWTGATVLILVAWAAGQLLRDRTWITAQCFYVPSLAYAVVLAGLALRFWCRRRRRFAPLLALAVLGPLCIMVFAENQWRSPPAPTTEPAQFRLVHWNIWYGKLGWRGILRQLITAKPDLCVLSEVLPETELDRVAPMLGDGYDTRLLGNVAVLARGTLGESKPLTALGAQVYLVPWQVDGERLLVMTVDIPSLLLRNKEPILRVVREHIAKAHPDLVVGDFNAPRRSLALADLPEGYAHAYRTAGRGWSYTWPSIMPVLAIDQCITGPRVLSVDYDLDGTRSSDHRLQRLAFSLRPSDKE